MLVGKQRAGGNHREKQFRGRAAGVATDMSISAKFKLLPGGMGLLTHDVRDFTGPNDYSQRSATNGSTLVARRAGNQHARNAANARMATIAASVRGSRGLTSKSIDFKKCETA